MFKIPLEIILWIYDTFDNNFGTKKMFLLLVFEEELLVVFYNMFPTLLLLEGFYHKSDAAFGRCEH